MMMAAKKIGCSFSCLAASSSPFHFQHTTNAQLSLSQFINQKSGAQLAIHGKDKSYQFIHGSPKLQGRLQKQQSALYDVFEDQSQYSELETAALVPQNHDPNPEEDISSASNSSFPLSGSEGKTGIISFYICPYRRDGEVILSNLERTHQNSKWWFIGPAVLVASFAFPSLYLRRVLLVIFEDSLMTDFLVLFFTEAVFYSGVAVFILLLDHLRGPVQLDDSAANTANNNFTPTPQLGLRISYVATLVLSLTIPMVTMGLVWPWTGPAASATLAPYLVGIVVQFAFEQYARYWKSPSWPAIPFLFQVYRLHQLNRASQLVTSLSYSVRGAELTPHNLAINGSLGTISNVLHFLLVICIWSISNFIMRFLPSASATMH